MAVDVNLFSLLLLATQVGETDSNYSNEKNARGGDVPGAFAETDFNSVRH
jgi:hypothetical protein